MFSKKYLKYYLKTELLRGGSDSFDPSIDIMINNDILSINDILKLKNVNKHIQIDIISMDVLTPHRLLILPVAF